MGQLVKIIRAEFLVDAESDTKVEGLPIFAEELEQRSWSGSRERRRASGNGGRRCPC